MKRLLFVFLFISAVLAVRAQGSNTTNRGKNLIVFYSWSGNSRSLANNLRSIADGEIVEIMPAAPYTKNYSEMLETARQEIAAIDAGNYPAVNTPVINIAAYEAVFIIYPLWWSRMATPMQAFLKNNSDKLRGKTLALICTSGSSGISQSLADARRLCPDSKFTEALHIRSAAVGSAGDLLAPWLEQTGFIPGK
jgi:flavodoxin